MVNLGSNFLIFFGLSCLLAFVFPFVKDGVFKRLSIKPLLSALPAVGLTAIFFGGLFGFAAHLGTPVEKMVPCFFGAYAVALGLARIGLPAQLRGVLLLVASYVLGISMPSEAAVYPVAAAMLGLLSAKMQDSLLLNGEHSLDDILPPMIWLTGVAWTPSLMNSQLIQQRMGILLGVLSVVQILRIMQRPFTKDDKVFLKRIMLSLSGGLCILLVLTKLAVDQADAPMALLCGAGLFSTYLFQFIDQDGQNKIEGTTAVKMLIVIGMLTIIATRFYGIFGLLVLAPAAMVAPRSCVAQFAGMFFCLRALTQVFLVNFNSNVTGINLNHAYTNAAQYAGFILIACLALLLRDVKDKRVLVALFMVSGALVPMASNYYIHAEPTSSLLLALSAAAVIFSTLGPAFIKGETEGYENLLLMPAMMIASSITFGHLIDAGNEATNDARVMILVYAVGAVLLCLVGGKVFAKINAQKKVPVAVSGD